MPLYETAWPSASQSRMSRTPAQSEVAQTRVGASHENAATKVQHESPETPVSMRIE